MAGASESSTTSGYNAPIAHTDMATLIWASPLLAVILLLATGRATTMTASAVGTALAVAVAVSGAAPSPLALSDTYVVVAKGLWLGWLAGSVILGGLFFQQALQREKSVDSAAMPGALIETDDARRRRLFAACFLIGPFTESATGFGVGYVIALGLISQLKLRPLHLLIFGLFSQMLVPWGALAVGTMVGAHLSGVAPAELGMRSAILTVPLLAAWLLLFWYFAGTAGFRNSIGQRVDDVLWTAAAAALLLATSRVLDPEVAAVAALGPLIALRFWRDAGGTGASWRAALHTAAPYAALTVVLIAGRAISPVHEALTTHAVLRPPLPDATPWPVLLHPFAWLMLIPIVHAALAGRSRAILPALRATWRHGQRAFAATVLFLVMAQLIAASGVASGLAQAFLTGLGPATAIAASPLFAAIGGLLTGSTTGSNGLFMPSQVALGAAAGLRGVGWLAAVQNTAASAATMLSPIRVSMGCAWLGRPDLEQPTYRAAWLLGAVPFALAIVAAAVIPWLGGAN